MNGAAVIPSLIFCMSIGIIICDNFFSNLVSPNVLLLISVKLKVQIIVVRRELIFSLCYFFYIERKNSLVCSENLIL
jgi:hypothetical protein